MRRALTVSLVLGVAAATPAAGRMLETHTCAVLAAELGALDGARTLFERGPAAAKGSATRDQLDQVRRYIEVLGQVRFRCVGGGSFVALRGEPVDEADDAAALNAPIGRDAAGVTLPAKPEGPEVAPVKATPPKAASPRPAPTAKPAPPAKPARDPAAAKAPDPPKAKPAAVAAPAAPKPKTKPDDAFRPATAATKAE